MNIKKILIGSACVLASTVAAQTAHAQFMTPAENQMLIKAAEAFTTPKKQTQPAKPAPVQPAQKQASQQAQTNTSGYTYIGREGKIIQLGELFWERFFQRKVEEAAVQQAASQQQNTTK